jgi:prepilin-type N-terminal cleavage/methylation domain-containing protein
MSFNKTHSQGFTLVETLIAITILMIAIASPLVIASKGLTAALISRDQMIASLLAQESIEIVKNIRDNNFINDRVWSTGFSQCVRASPSGTIQCDFDAHSGYLIGDCEINGSLGCPLFLSSDGYVNLPPGDETQFSRYFYLTPHGVDDYTLTVVVSWNHGTIPNEVKLSTEITSTIR